MFRAVTSMPICFITGAAGFLGSHLGAAFRLAGYEIWGLDIRPPGVGEKWDNFIQAAAGSVNYGEIFGDKSPAVILHLAGSASVPASVSAPYDDFMSLLPGSARLLAWLGSSKSTARIILFSSAAVYGNPVELPVSERANIRPISPYGMHKAVAECLFEQYARTFSLSICVLRIFSAYGPGLRKQVVWDLIGKLARAVDSSVPRITLAGTGDETRDFIHVADIVSAVRVVSEMREESGFSVFNLASGTEVSIREVGDAVVDALQLPITVGFSGEKRSGDPSRWKADIGRLLELGWQPRISFYDGVHEVALWGAREWRRSDHEALKKDCL